MYLFTMAIGVIKTVCVGNRIFAAYVFGVIKFFRLFVNFVYKPTMIDSDTLPTMRSQYILTYATFVWVVRNRFGIGIVIYSYPIGKKRLGLLTYVLDATYRLFLFDVHILAYLRDSVKRFCVF